MSRVDNRRSDRDSDTDADSLCKYDVPVFRPNIDISYSRNGKERISHRPDECTLMHSKKVIFSVNHWLTTRGRYMAALLGMDSKIYISRASYIYFLFL